MKATERIKDLIEILLLNADAIITDSDNTVGVRCACTNSNYWVTIFVLKFYAVGKYILKKALRSF